MKAFEQLEPNAIMGIFAMIGNSVEIADKLAGMNQTAMQGAVLEVADYYLTKLTETVVEPKTGVAVFFNEGEAITFHTVLGRSGYDSKTVTKMLKEGLKIGTLKVEGVRRGRRYSLAV